MFQTSSRLASAYGIAVTGSMFVDTLLAYVVVRRHVEMDAGGGPAACWSRWCWSTLVFISSNLLKIPDGAWLPLTLGGGFVVVMWTWTRGTRILIEKTRRDSLPLVDLIAMLQRAAAAAACPARRSS